MRRLLVVLLLALLAAPAAAQAADRDRDRLPDRWERSHGLSAKRANAAADPDKDGASNRAEHRAKSHPRRRDTDRDSLSDGFELKRSGTSPRRRDSDRDRVPDPAEDPDGDGLSTGAERGLHTHPRRADSDADGLADAVELAHHRTDPLDPDTDGDGWGDARELRLGSSPRDAASKPRRPDTRIASAPRPLSPTPHAPFAFTATAPGARYECRLDNGAWAACSPDVAFGLPDGGHTLAVRSFNAEGWADDTPALFSWTVDTQAPAVRITSAPGAFLRSTTAGFGFSSDPGASFECRLDGGSWRGCSSPTYERYLAQGSHTFAVRARDGAGNVSAPAQAAPFVVDTLAPNTTITSAPSGSVVGSATFSFSATESGRFECRIDFGAYLPCSSPATFSGLAVGSHSLRVRALDEAGNADRSPARANFSVAG